MVLHVYSVRSMRRIGSSSVLVSFKEAAPSTEACPEQAKNASLTRWMSILTFN